MGGRGTSRRVLGLAVLGVAALAFGGCDWTIFGYDAALTHFSADNNINSANVSTVKQLFTANGAYASPVESGGVVYAGGQKGNLYAFDANGVTAVRGTPNLCSPLWTGDDGWLRHLGPPQWRAVWSMSSRTHPRPQRHALRLRRQRGDQLLGHAQGVPAALDRFHTAAGSVAGRGQRRGLHRRLLRRGLRRQRVNRLLGHAQGVPAALDQHAQTPHSPRRPSPTGSSTPPAERLETTRSSPIRPTAPPTARAPRPPAVPCGRAPWAPRAARPRPPSSNGVVYTESNDAKLFAFDASGVTDCSGTPTTCSPLWTAALSGTPNSAPRRRWPTASSTLRRARSRPSTPTASPTARERPRRARRCGPTTSPSMPPRPPWPTDWCSSARRATASPNGFRCRGVRRQRTHRLLGHAHGLQSAVDRVTGWRPDRLPRHRQWQGLRRRLLLRPRFRQLTSTAGCCPPPTTFVTVPSNGATVSGTKRSTPVLRQG